jgi:uncharacterized Zn finger protein (UPF0148 family)
MNCSECDCYIDPMEIETGRVLCPECGATLPLDDDYEEDLMYEEEEEDDDDDEMY